MFDPIQINSVPTPDLFFRTPASARGGGLLLETGGGLMLETGGDILPELLFVPALTLETGVDILLENGQQLLSY